MIAAEGLTVQRKRKRLLDGVSCALEARATTVVVGPNGAGKSTLLRALAGDLRPTSGAVTWEGQPLGAVPAQELARRRAVVMQDTGVPFSFLVAEVIALGVAPWQLTFAELSAVLEEAAACVDVAHLLDRDVRTLSGGERQRVQLARALAQLLPGSLEGAGLLLDEPLSALDVGQQQRLLELFGELRARGLTLLAVMHDMNAALQCADQVVVLKAGRLLAAGAALELDLGALLTEAFETPMYVQPRPGGRAPLVLPGTHAF